MPPYIHALKDKLSGLEQQFHSVESQKQHYYRDLQSILNDILSLAARIPSAAVIPNRAPHGQVTLSQAVPGLLSSYEVNWNNLCQQTEENLKLHSEVQRYYNDLQAKDSRHQNELQEVEYKNRSRIKDIEASHNEETRRMKEDHRDATRRLEEQQADQNQWHESEAHRLKEALTLPQTFQPLPDSILKDRFSELTGRTFGLAMSLSKLKTGITSRELVDVFGLRDSCNQVEPRFLIQYWIWSLLLNGFFFIPFGFGALGKHGEQLYRQWSGLFMGKVLSEKKDTRLTLW